ncbi:Uncharacterized protein PBTT_04472 [Plasmodiophora brassicae]
MSTVDIVMFVLIGVFILIASAIYVAVRYLFNTTRAVATSDAETSVSTGTLPVDLPQKDDGTASPSNPGGKRTMRDSKVYTFSPRRRLQDRYTDLVGPTM